MAVTAEPDARKRATHTVINQAPPLVDYDLFTSDRALVEALEREGGSWARPQLAQFGRLMGDRQSIALGFQANENPPVLHTHDRFGNRIDEVEFHPSWHELLRMSIEHGIHNLPWREAREGAHVARSALMMLASQNEAGHGCPISMTYSVVPVLRKQPDVGEEWIQRICTASYDRRFRPAAEKTGVLLGMGMTEKQGGSDVRANSTRAVPVKAAGPGQPYLLTGHKWFCSAPMCDAFLILAQAPGGLSCFLLPRWTPEGGRNRFLIQRLKHKLGNRSNASSEVEFDEALAWLVGEEGRGVATIIEMVNHTRLDCVISSSAFMRQALVQAIHHARHRAAFGHLLCDQPLMQNVLADLSIESEAATVLMMRLARAYDQAPRDPGENTFRRIATAVAKYWICKRTAQHVVECLECLGGNGFVEESILPRLYRESPLNSIWEGSGNIICLDVLRALRNEPESASALLAEINLGVGQDRRLDAYAKTVGDDILKSSRSEVEARRLVERMALSLQASLLVRHAPPAVADAFCATRLGGDWGHAFGTLPSTIDAKKILALAAPVF